MTLAVLGATSLTGSFSLGENIRAKDCFGCGLWLGLRYAKTFDDFAQSVDWVLVIVVDGDVLAEEGSKIGNLSSVKHG